MQNETKSYDREKGSYLELDQKNTRKLKSLIVFTILVLIGVYRFDVVVSSILFILNVFTPLILGCAIAFILNVPMVWIQKMLFSRFMEHPSEKKGKRLAKMAAPLSLLLSILFVCTIIIIVISVVLPQLAITIADLTQTLPNKIPPLFDKVEHLVSNNPQVSSWIGNLEINWQKLMLNMVNFFKSGASTLLGSTLVLAMGILSAFTTFFIGFVFACYILLQKKTLGRQMRQLLYAFLPEKAAKKVIDVASLTHMTFTNFLTGQCLEAVILGTMFFITMSIFKFPYALLVGVLISFTALIPIFGAFIGCVVGAFLILTVNPPQAFAFIILFLILQQTEGNFIYPYVVGGSVGLPSIWVLAAVTIGGSLFGILGMLLFIPIASVIYTLLREATNARLEKKQLSIT